MTPAFFSGNSNPLLAHDTAKLLGLDLGAMEIVRFADTECRVRIEEDIEGKDAFIIQSLSEPVDEHLMEMLLMCDAAKRLEARKIIAIIPYHGYARQDRIHRPGECLSASVVAKVLETVGFDKVITVSLHSDSTMGFFKVPVVHLSGLSVFDALISSVRNDVVVVSPDAGGMKRAQKFAEEIDAPLAFIEKKRDLNQMHKITSMKVVGDVEGKSVIIVDDVIVSGGTLVNAAYMLKEKGAVQVIAAATHADFVGGANKILQESPLDQIWVTDTISIPEEKRFEKLKVVSCAPIIAEAMRKMIKTL
jgi:ribose-phosphate pyrophosphokinase